MVKQHHGLNKFDKKCTTRELRTKICKFAKSYGLHRVCFNSLAKHVDGTYNPKNDVVFLSLKQSKQNLLMSFFHELAHFEALCNNLWVEYHLNSNTTLHTAEEKFHIENQIDRIAKALWNKYVNTKVWGKYKYTYSIKRKKEHVEWFAESFVNKNA
jgi:hypothetical protein